MSGYSDSSGYAVPGRGSRPPSVQLHQRRFVDESSAAEGYHLPRTADRRAFVSHPQDLPGPSRPYAIEAEMHPSMEYGDSKSRRTSPVHHQPYLKTVRSGGQDHPAQHYHHRQEYPWAVPEEERDDYQINYQNTIHHPAEQQDRSYAFRHPMPSRSYSAEDQVPNRTDAHLTYRRIQPNSSFPQSSMGRYHHHHHQHFDSSSPDQMQTDYPEDKVAVHAFRGPGSRAPTPYEPASEHNRNWFRGEEQVSSPSPYAESDRPMMHPPLGGGKRKVEYHTVKTDAYPPRSHSYSSDDREVVSSDRAQPSPPEEGGAAKNVHGRDENAGGASTTTSVKREVSESVAGIMTLAGRFAPAPKKKKPKTETNTTLLDMLCSATLEVSTPDKEEVTVCSCPKSRCLKMYCDCFQAGTRCSNRCSCTNCKNTTAESGVDGERTKAISAILSRNPHAFTDKLTKELREAEKKTNDVVCKCVKSQCLKLYCDCFQSGSVCNSFCTCYKCFNTVAESQEGGKRTRARELCLQRNPNAFKKKERKVGSGCACKNSRCLKKYCECFNAGLYCADKCVCIECENAVKTPQHNPATPLSPYSFHM